MTNNDCITITGDCSVIQAVLNPLTVTDVWMTTCVPQMAVRMDTYLTGRLQAVTSQHRLQPSQLQPEPLDPVLFITSEGFLTLRDF